MKQRFKYTWRIDFVGKMMDIGDEDWYVIIGEKLGDITDKDGDIFQDLKDTVYYMGTEQPGLKQSKSYLDFVERSQSTKEITKEEYARFEYYPKHTEWMFYALKELDNANILFDDNHGGNIRKGKKNWKFIDLGSGSQGPAANVPNITEHINRMKGTAIHEISQ